MPGLRVIAGTARGRRLARVPGSGTRPIRDSVKEALFNIIGADIVDSAFLDLFAGTGSVGIEALSRGAASCLFIDSSSRAMRTVRQNLAGTGLAAGATVLQTDALSYLRRPPESAFDYIYVAPPQYKEMWQAALAAIEAETGWLRADGWVIAQIDPAEFQELSLAELESFDQRRYGTTLLVFYRLRGA